MKKPYTLPVMPQIATISLVIPVFNEEDNLPILAEQIRQALEPLEAQGRTFKTIFIDDGSRDGSLAVMRDIAKADPRFCYLAFAANCGQSAGFGAGFEAAQGDVVVTMDADLQNDPADIPAMIETFEAQDADMVIGWRQKRRDSWIKRIASKIGNNVRNRLTRETVRDTGCSLKVMRADMARRMPMFHGMHRFMPTLMKLQGAKVVEVPVNHRPREHGQSKYGTLDRAMAGGYDLFAVRWMQSRHRRWEIKERG